MLARSQADQSPVSPLAAEARDRLPPAPLLEGIERGSEGKLTEEPVDVARKRQAANNEILHSYGWVDEKQQIVRIPIGQAMDIEAAKLHSASTKDIGAPKDGAAPKDGYSPIEAEMPHSSNSGRMLKEVSP
jgi:hypothetical protein